MLQHFPPMGVYETLFKFAERTQKYMGDPGTHPWAQGYPLTTQIPGGPELPAQIDIGSTDLKYPKATGEIELREAIANYYNEYYAAGITPDHVAIFAGGRPGIFAILAFLQADIRIAVDETEYTPYYDMLELLQKKVELIPSNVANRFRPGPGDYGKPCGDASRIFLLKSNPCNPTGITTTGDALAELVGMYSQPGRGALFDEAYEFYNDPEPESALKYIDDIDATDVFVVGAATKGLQVPGMRTGSSRHRSTSKYFATTRHSVWAAFRAPRNCMLRSFLSLHVYDTPARLSPNFLHDKENVTARAWRISGSSSIPVMAGFTTGAGCRANCRLTNSTNGCSNTRRVFCPGFFATWRAAGARADHCIVLCVFPSAP
jgi:hypothetical protein